MKAFFHAYRWMIICVTMPIALLLGLGLVLLEPAYSAITLSGMKHLYLGLMGGFVVHELAHAALISLTMLSINSLRFSRKLNRFSILVTGCTTGRGVFLTACCGPLVTAIIGVALYLLVPQVSIHGWYLIHIIFVLPFFGDGKAMLFGICHWKEEVKLSEQETL